MSDSNKPHPHLLKLRDEIIDLDQEIIKLLEDRLDVARKVGEFKFAHGLNLTHPKREQEVVERLKSKADDPFLKNYVDQIYESIFTLSKKVQVQIIASKNQEKLPPCKIGIIGYGHFGQMLCKTFKNFWPSAQVLVNTLGESGEGFHSLEEVGSCDYVFPAVPIGNLKACLTSLVEFVSSKTTVIDVCSVKVLPARWMEEILSSRCNYIASHPMFGPESTSHGKEFTDLNLMVSNLNAPAQKYDRFKGFFSNLGVNIVEITPEEHDRYAAYTINYNHLIGRIGERVGIAPTCIDTKGFRVIYHALQYVTHDTWDLFVQMQSYNPYASQMRQKVFDSLSSILTELKSHGLDGEDQ